MVLILVPKITNRLKYIMQLMLQELLGLDYSFTTDRAVFSAHVGPRFAYGCNVESDELFFGSIELLFETRIAARELRHFNFEGGLVFFPVANSDSVLPFDIFAASFYLVSRYEEYLPHLRDNHNRYLAGGSDAYQQGYLQKPLVNQWALRLRDLLKNRFNLLQIRVPDYKFVPTIDIDAAYAYKNKGLTRAIGGILKSLQNKDWQEVKARVKVLMRLEKDPFDTFDLQMELQQKFGYQPMYFVLLADYGTNDKNIPYNNRYFQNLIRYLADYADIGIHPSYASSNDPALMVMETARLSRILKLEIEHSRQHFLKLNLPETYRNLLNNDILHDYTMGYAEEPGFRASICTPFYFYDLDQDLPTNLMIHPFTVMEGTLKDYMKLTPLKASELIAELIYEVKNVGGTFMPLWHNSSLNNTGEWEGWLDVYIKMAEEASS